MNPRAPVAIPQLPHPDADHYRIDGSERPMPRTTSVIDRTLGKPFLSRWAGRLERDTILAELAVVLAEEIEPARARAIVARLRKRLPADPFCEVEKNTAGAFGTATHALVEAHLRARLGNQLAPEPAPASTEPQVERAARLAVEWFDAVEFEPDPRGIEIRLWSADENLWSAGTADAFGTAHLGRMIAHSRWNRPAADPATTDQRVPVLVDLKTSKSIGVAHKIQTAAYVAYLLEQGRIEAPCHTCILRVARHENDPRPTEALLIHPDEVLRYGGAFRFLRRIYNFVTQEEVLERQHWRARGG